MMPDPADDAALFRAWTAGEKRAGAALIERHYDSVERFFDTKVADRAEDLAQLTFLRCAEAATTWRGDGGFRAFLFGVARNVLREHIRGRVRDGRRPMDFDTASIADLVPGAATLAARSAEQLQLARALQRLPLDLQELVELYYWEELSVEELAACVGVPAGTIKSRLHRARALLKEAMDALPEGEEGREGARTLLRQWVERVRG